MKTDVMGNDILSIVEHVFQIEYNSPGALEYARMQE